VDWREKLKATRKSSKKRVSNSSSPDPSSAPRSQFTQSAAQPAEAADIGMTADGKPNLELLSKGLPAGWRAMWDKNTGDIYYGNLKTRVRFCLPPVECSISISKACFLWTQQDLDYMLSLSLSCLC